MKYIINTPEGTRDRLFSDLPRGAAEAFLTQLELPAPARPPDPLEGELEAFYRRAGLCPPEDRAVEAAALPRDWSWTARSRRES